MSDQATPESVASAEDKALVSQLISKTDELLQNYERGYKRLTFDNRINNFPVAEVAAHARTTYPIVHARVLKLMQEFLEIKRQHGSSVEKALYKDLGVVDLADRIMTKRPLMFMTGQDQWVLKDGQRGMGGFEDIGSESEKAPLLLKDYLSYDEMQISALFGVSAPSHFINEGGRSNQARKAQDESAYEHTGVYTALVGTRFEKRGLMEWQHMMLDARQNSKENGYGPDADDSNIRTLLLKAWAKLYQKALGDGVSNFPVFQDPTTLSEEQQESYLPCRGALLNKKVFKERLRMSVEPFLLDANDRAKSVGKKAYTHIVGLGLGVWAVHDAQKYLMVEVYQETLEKLDFPHIAAVDFSWFGDMSMGEIKSGSKLPGRNQHITVYFSKRDPCARLTGEHAGQLLIAQYAWDSNSYPGNEYWAGMYAASGDPAAACCSTIPQLQNPDINDRVSGKYVMVLGDDYKHPTPLTDLASNL